MPRPGPRPYECVRRAWHSDRHLPIRGSLIQEIFRLVGEVHCTATKKNKEWQEKLPIVVLKAEEIMYSKANSEAEYVDLKTLGERVNDAINTIIRNDDESAVNGKLLQPCIEAALHLGCTPRRSSRSQQNNNPRYYLTSGNREDPSALSGNVDNKGIANQTTKSPLLPRHSKFMVDAKTSSFPSCFASNRPIVQQTDRSSDRFFCSEKCYRPSDDHQCVTPPSNTSYSVYPLYFGEPIQPANSKSIFTKPTTLDSHFVESANICPNRNISPTKSCIQNVDAVAFLECTSDKPLEVGCDLSLRLGPLVVPIPYSQGLENAGVGSSKEGTNDFFGLPKAYPNDQLDSSSAKWSNESHNDVEPMIRKRKAIGIYSSKNRQLVGS